MNPHSTGENWKLFGGDCLDAANWTNPGRFALIYIDPPFFTGNRRSDPSGSFDDAWGNDIEHYTEYLRMRISALRPLLTDDGSMLIHLDWRAVHYVKTACDSVFGANRFQNEIIWAYSSGGGSQRRYGRKHDTILWYSAGADSIFNVDEARVAYDAIIAKKRRHLFHDKGKVCGDVLDIPRPANHAREWVGWPDQKPLALLDWFVRVHTRPGDCVADFFCGSGTTLVAAVKAGRRTVGVDMSSDALAMAAWRLREITSLES